MLDGIAYTEQDAEFDSQLVFREIEDLDPATCMGNALLGKHGTEQDSQIRRTIEAHLKNVRFSRFAREAILSEYHNCEVNAASTTNTNTDQQQPGEGSGNQEAQQEAYRTRLSECNRIAALWIPNVEQMISDAGSVRVESSMKQMKKDIERDRLLVNGIRIVGAELGLDIVLQRICDVCDRVHTECGVPTLGNEVKEFAVLSLLSKASRSHSGGVAFQAVQALIDPSIAMIIPQSAVTPPLKVNIHLGAFPSSSSSSSRCSGSNAGAHTARLTATEGSCTSIADIPASPTDENHPNFGTGHNESATACAVNNNKCRWGLVCKVTCESIFKIQLFDAPEEVGYDDCSTCELEQGDDEAPCLFRPVSAVSAAASAVPTDSVAADSTAGPSVPDNVPSNSTYSGSGVGTGELNAQFPGITIGHRNTFVSVIYEDYVLFEVKLSPAGELCNLENLVDNWKETASVSITEIVPVRTLM